MEQTYEEWVIEYQADTVNSFEDWKEHVKKYPRNGHFWQNVGDWFFPTPRNTSTKWQGAFWHLCRENYIRDMNPNVGRPTSCRDRCVACGMDVPDNIKMIAGLLSW